MTNEPTPDLKIGVAESATDRPDGTEPRAEFVSACTSMAPGLTSQPAT